MNKASRKLNDPRHYCRTCGHVDWMHVKTWSWACGIKPQNNIDVLFFGMLICPCKEYLPEDNLEYLELCFKKRSQS